METIGRTPQSSVKRQHADVLTEMLAIPGKLVVDVGCGNGHISRDLIRLGADQVIGIDPGTKQLARATSQKLAGAERYVRASAEALPIPSESADIVIFFNSLHHVANPQMDQAFKEAERVLKPNGMMLISEPLAEGPQFDLSKLINDETKVRANAYEKIQDAEQYQLTAISERYYIRDGVHKDFESYKLNSISVNPQRSELFKAHESELHDRFHSLGVKLNDGYHFEQVIRVNLLAKP